MNPDLPHLFVKAARASMVVLAIPVLAKSASALHVGNFVRANTGVNVRSSPAGSMIGTRTLGDLGSVVDGPVSGTLPGGRPLVWWRIDWSAGVDGWSFEGGLDQRTLTEGIDVSNWQGAIDWAKVAGEGGRVFAIAKATEGTGFVDAQFTRNMSQGRAAGLVMGAYHFARPAATPSLSADALAEARHYVKTLHPWLDDGGLWPVLDLEDGSALGKSALSAWTRTFLTEVRRLTTSDSVIYTSRTYAQNSIDADLAAYPLWIAVPGTTPGANTFDLGPWPRWTLQQHSWTGQVPGITGDVDLNTFSGDATQLQALVLPPLTHTLSSLQAIPAVAARGTSLSLSATITSSRARQLLLGATLFPAGLGTGGISDPLRDQSISMPQGAASATRTFVLPGSLNPGSYDLVVALYLDLDDSGTINSGDLSVGSSRRSANALQIEAVPNFDTWAAAAGLTDDLAFPMADPDQDGWTNILEYAFHTPPTAPQAEPPLILRLESGAAPDTRVLRLRFPRWPNRTDLTYSVEQTTDPRAEDWRVRASSVGGNGFKDPSFTESGASPVVVTMELPINPDTPTYLRVRVTRP